MMTPILARHAARALVALNASPAKSASIFVAPDLVVRVTRPGRRKTHGRSRSHTVLVTTGKPNYRARAFVKACRAAKEPFPVKKIQFAGTW